MSDERFLEDQSGNGRDLKPWTAEELPPTPEQLQFFAGEFVRVCNDLPQRAVWKPADVSEIGYVYQPGRAFVQGPFVNPPAPAYEPIELLCGSYSSSEKPQRYLLPDVRRWAKGDFDDLHSTPREVIATLADALLCFLKETFVPPLPRTRDEWNTRWHQRADSPNPVVVGASVWVNLHERHPGVDAERTAEQFIEWLKGLRPWVGQIGEQTVSAPRLERWARGDQRDLRADAVTAMRGLAGEVLRLAGLEE